MLLTEFIVNQCSGQVPTSLLVAAALPSNRLKSTSNIRVRSQINCRFVTHPTHLFERWSKLVGGGIPHRPAIPLTAK
jgi:hypothetical protein